MTRSSWIVASVTAAVFALHAAVSGSYDFYRDEVYFIVCGRHPAFGYVDQPPIVPLLAAGTQVFGESRAAIHMSAALGGAAIVVVSWAAVRLLRGGLWAQFLAVVAIGFAPIYLALTSILSTSTFEPLLWTLTAYFAMRAVVDADRRAILLAGLTIGLALEIKDIIPSYVAALVVGVALTPDRKLLRTREFGLALAIASILAAPSFLWQLMHGFPMLEVFRAYADRRNAILSPPAFVGNQTLMVNPLLAPVWIAGVAAPFVDRAFIRLRFLSVAFVSIFAAMLALHAKSYYLSPAFGAELAVGAVALERWVRSAPLRKAYLTLALLSAAVLAPLPIPMLPPQQYLTYQHFLRFHDAPIETRPQSAIPQIFADMTGWHALAQSVAVAYGKLSPHDRAHAAILTSNFGEAGAIDVLGGRLGLPEAISGHNNFFLWGPGAADGGVVLLVGAKLRHLESACREVRTLAAFGAPFALPDEHGDIVLCRDLGRGLRAEWPRLRHYD